MTCSTLLVLIAGLVPSVDPPADAVKKELDKFQGTWRLISLEAEGTKVPEEALKDIRLSIKGDKFTTSEGKNSFGGTFKFDPTKKPKTIDVQFHEGPQKGQVSLGIYELEGDTYRICVDMAGKGRPSEFAGRRGTGYALEVYQRVKP